ncbi:O-linked N-acetylglucosamine transferase, SPINDLY family protein [Arenibaculum pallidiluteum]|uniref:O-linked N-acetylglucosamine transferase, SPINDLY family protein n=1 Tax=Arenibaculum pallidiluteum TaxID=2812559 RepID=UPI001A9618BA|nr:tetratricopeptide repeat protein [Arenibaculum pallidiluteum]
MSSLSRQQRRAAQKAAAKGRPVASASMSAPSADASIATLFDKAVAAHHAGRLDEAEAAYREIAARQPDHTDALSNLGVLLKATGRLDEAIATYERALAIRPAPMVLNNLSCALMEAGRAVEAVEAVTRAVAGKPDYAEGHYNLGNALRQAGRFDEAKAAYLKAVSLKADFAAPWSNLGDMLKGRNQFTEAVECFVNAIRRQPGLVEAYNNLAETLKDQGRHREARQILEKGLELAPGHAVMRSNYAFCLCYMADIPPEQILREHEAWGRIVAAPLARGSRPFANRPEPQRRLRIGYVSPDFNGHSVSHFFEGVLRQHDRAAVEVFCYSNGQVVDETTERLRRLADHWRVIRKVPDETVARMIEADGIDILVDLAGHTANHRLTVFARRPAPVQATWIGYPNTTGMAAMDYRIVDAVTDPPGSANALCTEKLWRLPDTFLCYRPQPGTPEVAPLPAAVGAPFTFGSFNNLAKVTDHVIATWSEILRRVPGARLLLKAKQFLDGGTRDRVVAAFAAQGIEAGRLVLLGATASPRDHLALYGQVDLALDPFPYNGTTTTCEALWMGVPTVTLLGRTHVARVGATLNLACGLGHLVAPDLAAYVETAVAQAADTAGLAALRARLREQVAASPLCDAPRFTRNLEFAYRGMWQAWCASGQVAATRPAAEAVPA